MKIEEAIEELKINGTKEPLEISGSATRMMKYFKALDIAIEALEEKKNNTWVSVKDRLPPEPRIGENGYIVQEKNVCEPFSAYWDGERWTDSNYEPIDDVIAWMPLPESYKED